MVAKEFSHVLILNHKVPPRHTMSIVRGGKLTPRSGTSDIEGMPSAKFVLPVSVRMLGMV